MNARTKARTITAGEARRVGEEIGIGCARAARPVGEKVDPVRPDAEEPRLGVVRAGSEDRRTYER